MSPEDIVSEAVAKKVDTLALTDINNCTGIFDFVKACRESHVRPVAGMEFRHGDEHLFTGIARNNGGFRELNEFLTKHQLAGEPLPFHACDFSDTFIIYPFGKSLSSPLKDHEYIGIRPEEAGKLVTSRYRYNQAKLVVWSPVTFRDRAGYELHRHLRAIDRNTLLSMLRPEHLASPCEHMVTPDRLLEPFGQWPQVVRNTERLLSECTFEFDFSAVKNKKTFTGSAYDDKLLLEKLAFDGLEYRYGRRNKEAEKRVRQELDIICRLGFAAYFLIAGDLVRYSMSRGYYHVGRGSGANSVVAYCLKITDVDPIELDLYFERFINPKRTSPPDFDIDYSWKERDDVLDYIFKRYGRAHTALLGTTPTFKGRSILRELGKVYGLPKQELDDLVDHPETIGNRDGITRKIMAAGAGMANFPNMRSIHAGGVLISEEPITCYTALDLPPKGFPTTQWDMYVAEEIGFEKLDILSQRGIGHIREAAEIISRNRGTNVDVHQVGRFKKDPKVKQLLESGRTIGCFYIESPAMRGLISKLRCSDYLTLVAASSIIRPGVAKSGMMREYIFRFHNPDKFRYLHPVMEQQLKETYGVMVYQEDVLKVCHHFAGLDLADADVLRRAMSGKYRSKKEFQRIVDKFHDNCRAKGYPDELTREVWRQIESFAGYSFSKAHSASYAVESYQSLYLKTYYPVEFMVAVINNFGGFYQSWVYINEARKWGAGVHMPCVNHSDYTTTLEGNDIYLGFIHLSNLETRVGKAVVAERQQNGEYSGLENFIKRLDPGKEQLILLVRADAFRFTGKTKKELLWEAHLLLGNQDGPKRSPVLFETESAKFRLPPLEQNQLEHAFDEIELLGFPLTVSYFDLLQTSFRGEIYARGLKAHVGRKVRMVGHLVTIKYVWTAKQQWMHFAAFLDANGDFFDTVHFPPVVKSHPFRGNGIYLIYGKVVEESGFPSIEVEKLAKLPIREDPRYS